MVSHHERVDGVYVPVRLSGHPALDLCNSYAGWGEHSAGDTGDEPGDRRDYLRSYDALAVFAGYADVLDAAAVDDLRGAAGRAAGPARRVLDRTRRFRAGLYTLATSRGTTSGTAAGTASDTALATVTEELTRARAVARPAYGERLSWYVPADTGLAAPLLAFALAADDLLTRTGIEEVTACAGSDCGWLFLDPAGRRRWCSMASCGNRAKARRFAARTTARTTTRSAVPTTARSAARQPDGGLGVAR